MTEYAWKYRYPGEPMEPDREEAQEALGVAREVWREVLGRPPFYPTDPSLDPALRCAGIPSFRRSCCTAAFVMPSRLAS